MKGKIVLIFLGVCLAVSGAWMWKYASPPSPAPLTLYGNVDIREVDLGFRVFGKVQALFFEEGDIVKKGDLLATLDPTPYEEKKQAAQAALLYAQTSLANAQTQWQRRKQAIASSSISQENLSNAESAQEEQKAALLGAQASLQSAETACEDTKLFAPSDGILLSRIREIGSILNPGQPVYTLALDKPVWVRAFVSEMDLGKIYPGMKALVYTDTPSLPAYEGYIGFISPVAEFTPKNVETTSLRTDLVYRIRIYIPKPGAKEGLRQGMPVTVSLPT